MKNLYLYILCILVLFGCNRDLTREQTHPFIETIHTKVVNTSEDAVEGMLMFKASDKGVDLSGLRIPALEINSIERAFPANGKNAEKLSAMGLDSWYVIRFNKNVSLDNAALNLAQSSAIEKIQFNTRLKLFDEPIVKSLSAGESAALDPQDFNDPFLPDQWNLINRGSSAIAASAREGADVSVKDAWSLTTGDPAVVVAVLDQGVQYNHPDLAANMWTNDAELNGVAGVDDDNNGFVDDIYGYNFVSDGEITWDKPGDSGHGTHAAGVISAVNNNGIGISSIAGGSGNSDGVRIMSCQVFENGEGGDALSVARGIMYATDNGAAIISCSFGANSGFYTFDAQFEQNNPVQLYAIRYFMEYGGGDVMEGGLPIFASGNDSGNISCYPAAHNSCISVTAIGPDYLPAAYTNYGPGSNIAAPGGDTTLGTSIKSAILSTVPTSGNSTGYAYMEGTSMACPHVSGVAALGLSYAKQRGKKFTREEFANMLLCSVNDIDTQLDREKNGMNLHQYKGGMGTGLIDAWKLLMQIDGTPSLMVPVGQEVYLDLSSALGSSAGQYDNYAIVQISIPNSAVRSLGIEETPVFEYGKLRIKCTKTGSTKVTVKMLIDYKFDISGNATDLSYMTRELSLISRGVVSNNGGWL